MRLVLAKMLYTFDIELIDTKLDWQKESKYFTLWFSPPLNVEVWQRSKAAV
jgi:hypothetical protein